MKKYEMMFQELFKVILFPFRLPENYPEYPEWLHEYSNGDHVDFVVKLGYSRDMVKSLVLRHFDETGTQYKSLSELLADVQKVAEIWVSTENLITEGKEICDILF